MLLGFALLGILLSVTTAVRNKPTGWYAVYNLRVYFSDQVADWNTAMSSCEDLGSNLLPMTGVNQSDVIRALLGSDAVTWWVGVSDVTNEGQYRSSDGVVHSYTDWFPGFTNGFNKQPSLSSANIEQDCVELRRIYGNSSGTMVDTGRFYWNDQSCGAQNYYICSIKYCGFETTSHVSCQRVGQRSVAGCCRRNKRLTGSLLFSREVRSAIECVSLCVENISCMSVNYESNSHTCEINFNSVASDNDLQVALGFSFYSDNLC